MSKQKYPQATTVSSSGTPTRRVSNRTSYNSNKLHGKRDRKRREADDRQFEYDKLSTAQKLTELGDTGSNRQRVRLTALLAKEKDDAKVKKQAKSAVAA